MLIYEKKVILKKTGSQDLSAGAMSLVTSFGKSWQLIGVKIHFDGDNSQTITITRDSTDGANYDTVIKSQVLSSETDFSWSPTEELLESGDEIKVEITTGGVTTAYATIIGKEI